MYDKLNIIERAILLNPENIKVFREKLKITQSKLAEESGVSQSHLSMLEKGKREIGEAHAAAITLGMLKCSNVWDKENPILYLLDVLSLTKLESAIVDFIQDLTLKNDILYKRYIEGHPVYIIDIKHFSEEIKKRLKVMDISEVEFFRGRMDIKGIHLDKKTVIIHLDCSDIRRLEHKVSKVLNNNTIIQIFTKDEVPPIYSIKKDCMIVHCW
ncbi:helix-turn-helix domain-containing protein [Methanococcus sp. CF]